jgi:hypothetical protein
MVSVLRKAVFRHTICFHILCGFIQKTREMIPRESNKEYRFGWNETLTKLTGDQANCTYCILYVHSVVCNAYTYIHDIRPNTHIVDHVQSKQRSERLLPSSKIISIKPSSQCQSPKLFPVTGVECELIKRVDV